MYYINKDTGLFIQNEKNTRNPLPENQHPVFIYKSLSELDVTLVDSDGNPYPLQENGVIVIAVDKDFFPETLAAYAEGTIVDAVNGKAKFIPNCSSPRFLSLTKTEKNKISAKIEINYIPLGKTDYVTLLQDTCTMLPRVLDEQGIPEPSDTNYYTKEQLSAILSAGDEYQFSANGTEWHEAPQIPGDAYMRSRNKSIAGDWSDAMEIPSGAPGASSYTYIAFAADDEGTGFSMIPSNSLQYRAEFVSGTEIEKPAAADFAGKWVKYIGDNGTPGTAGKAGEGFNTPVSPVEDADAVTPETGKITPYIRQTENGYEIAAKKPDGTSEQLSAKSDFCVDFATAAAVSESDMTCSIILDSDASTVDNVRYDFNAAELPTE